jgi:hypothetical protein
MLQELQRAGPFAPQLFLCEAFFIRPRLQEPEKDGFETCA